MNNPFLRGKIAKRIKARKEWMARQLNPKPPKDRNWWLKFEFCPHLGVYLLLKQFNLKEDELKGLLHAIIEE